MAAECHSLFLGSACDKLSGEEGKGLWRRDFSRSSTTHCCRERNSKMLSRQNNMDPHCVFVLLLPGQLLVLYCPHHVPNSMWNVALPALLTSLNSSGDRGQGHSLGPVFMVRWNVNSGWEKRGGIYNEASPLCWLFVWTDRLSHSSSCGWNTNGYD